MARPKNPNDGKILEMLKQGVPHRDIAQQVGCTRQNIGLKHRLFVKKGLLPVETLSKDTKLRKSIERKRAKQNGNGHLELEQAEQVLIKWAQDSARVRALEDEHWRLKNQLAAARSEIQRLNDYYRNREDAERKFRLAQQQGEIPDIGGTK